MDLAALQSYPHTSIIGQFDFVEQNAAMSNLVDCCIESSLRGSLTTLRKSLGETKNFLALITL
jgi:hypothetical protein